MLAARGLLSFGGNVDISAGAPASGGVQQAAQSGDPGTDPGNNGSGGATGNGGGQGRWYLDLYGCHVNYANGGTGGTGGAGGRGGLGGSGGASGASGAGGTGGLGTPGMVKLHGSVVLAGSGTVTCNNHTSSTDNALRGRTTLISNLSSPASPTFTDNYQLGVNRNDSWLRSSAPYALGVQSPMLPHLEGGLATAGFAAPGFWNEALFAAVHTGVPALELVELRGGNSPFLGFDQLFVVNNDAAAIEGVIVSISGYSPYLLGALPSGAIWTTTVPSGTGAAVSSRLSVSIMEPEIYAYTGESFELSALTEGGIAPMTWRWMLNGETVQNGASHVYAVASALAADAGVYTVEVSDSLPQQASSPSGAEAYVADPVHVLQSPQSVVAPVNGAHVFTVSATGGHGVLSYDWRKDGASLGAPDQPYLVLNPIEAASAGAYDVVIADARGVAPHGLVVSPPAPAMLEVSFPLIVTGPTDVIAYEDAAEAVFTAAVSGGTPPYAYTWRRDNIDLAPALQPLGPTLTLTGPLVGQVGSYRCVVTDSGVPADVESSETARLEVYPRLSFSQQPQGGNFYRGASVVLQALVSGGAPPWSYVWRKDGAPLPFEQQPLGPTLTFSAVQYADAGVYDLVVNDGYIDEIISEEANVAVAPPPPLQIVSQPQGGSVKVGGAFLFTLETAGGDGPLTHQWKHDDGDTVHDVGGNHPYLFVNDAVLADAGSYWAVVSDAVDALSTDPVVLDVVNEALIVITEQPEGALIAAGESHAFSVSVSGGAPPLSYAWFHDPGVGVAQPVGGNDSLLLVENAVRADTGSYWVEISDAYETVISDSAQLYVGLTVTAQPQGGRVVLGGSLTLSVEAGGGSGPLHYQWKFEGNAEKAAVNIGADVPQFLIEDASLSDAGDYWVEVSDDDDLVVSDAAAVTVFVESAIPAVGGLGLLLLTAALVWLAAAGPRRWVAFRER